jgi:hypothetical protein
VLGAAVTLDAGECPAGSPASLELLQAVEIASVAKALAPIKVVRVHIVMVPYLAAFHTLGGYGTHEI